MRLIEQLGLPKRKQNRLSEYDYSTPNAYFLTICTAKRANLFWQDVGAIIDRPQAVPLTVYGRAVNQAILNIPEKYPTISVDHYVIMPNHVHLLVQINTDPDGRSMIAPTISTVVQQMKGIASKIAGFSLWQKGYYDHVIRSDEDYLEVWQYIEGNPSKLAEDELYMPEREDA